MPKVSIVVPAHNAMVYLPQTIDSVLSQTFADFELLIINDGSSDHLIEWFSQARDSRIKLISQENQGVANARNTGILSAKGEYIAFLDADDIWEKTKLEKQVSCLDENPAVGLVYAWTQLINAKGKLLKFSVMHQEEGYIWEKIVIQDVVGSGSCAMVRASCFQQVGLFDQSVAIAADFDMWIRIAAVYEFAVLKEHLVFYRQHLTNASKDSQQVIKAHSQIIEKSFKNIPLELLYLRNRAYANLCRYQSWIALENGDYQGAKSLFKQATLHNQIWYLSTNYLRLSLAIWELRYFGEKMYLRNKSTLRNLRYLFSEIILEKIKLL
jgi:glycosyltransferase involved in cell wall biosynthesis